MLHADEEGRVERAESSGHPALVGVRQLGAEHVTHLTVLVHLLLGPGEEICRFIPSTESNSFLL